MSYYNNKQKYESVIKDVENEISKIFNIDPKIIYKKGRTPKLTEPRFVAWYLLCEKYKIRPGYVAEVFGYHRTTILHGIKNSKNMVCLVEKTANTVKNL